ncbi:amidohydrolase family protein [Janthinobacterium sp. GB4P2]|uniref:amidohydrolase family protein n=1 Tax=Janthinobacterium sp. GB4P2 TaxID=3424189 RepID=UPI003F1F7FDB
MSNYEPPLFTRMLDKAVAHGWPVLVHANGDKAVEYVLESYAQVLTPQPGGLSEEEAVFRTMEGASGKEVLNQEERLSRMAALRAVTLDAAWHCHLDHLVGSLEAGKRADLVILAQDPLDETVRKIRDIVVEETWLAGVRVHSKSA